MKACKSFVYVCVCVLWGVGMGSLGSAITTKKGARLGFNNQKKEEKKKGGGGLGYSYKKRKKRERD